MQDKFKLSVSENIFLAKKSLINNIYSNSRMEGINVTISQIQTILKGVNVPNLKIDEINCILNLRDAWKYVITNIYEEFNLNFICKINELVSRNESLDWGTLRKR